MKGEDDPEIKKFIKEIALWIKIERQKAKLSQIELSLKAGLSQNHVYAIETGQRFPNMVTFLKICKALNTNPARLFAPSDEEREKNKEIIINMIAKHL